ncbi:MAG TPA: ATP synthase F0 subunit B [Candidatus Tumulicola sp.]|nr:ATP synthase F0 subunit B [Candidatus Tumulicola sp.]
MLLSLDGTFLLQILNFLVFWTLLNFLFIGPTQRAIAGRQRHIAELYAKGDEYLAQAGALQAEAEAIYAEGRRATDEIMRGASSQASTEVRAIENKAVEEGSAIVQLAHATVASERATAVAAQGPFVQELARSMVAKAVNGDAA